MCEGLSCDVTIFCDSVVRKGNRTNFLSFMEVSSDYWRTEVLTNTACKTSVANLHIYWNWEPCFFYFMLTVHLSIIFDDDQLDTHLLYFTIRLL